MSNDDNAVMVNSDKQNAVIICAQFLRTNVNTEKEAARIGASFLRVWDKMPSSIPTHVARDFYGKSLVMVV